MKSHDIATFEALLKHQFSRPELLHQALTHSSQAREQEAQQRHHTAEVGMALRVELRTGMIAVGEEVAQLVHGERAPGQESTQAKPWRGADHRTEG